MKQNTHWSDESQKSVGSLFPILPVWADARAAEALTPNPAQRRFAAAKTPRAKWTTANQRVAQCTVSSFSVSAQLTYASQLAGRSIGARI